MIDEDIPDITAQVHEEVQLFDGLFIRVDGLEDAGLLPGLNQKVSAGGGLDILALGAEQRHILHDDLPADAVSSGQCTGREGGFFLLQILYDVFPSFISFQKAVSFGCRFLSDTSRIGAEWVSAPLEI